MRIISELGTDLLELESKPVSEKSFVKRKFNLGDMRRCQIVLDAARRDYLGLPQEVSKKIACSAGDVIDKAANGLCKEYK